MFNQLDEATKLACNERAKDEAAAARKAFEEARNHVAMKTPEELQLCVFLSGLVNDTANPRLPVDRLTTSRES